DDPSQQGRGLEKDPGNGVADERAERIGAFPAEAFGMLVFDFRRVKPQPVKDKQVMAALVPHLQELGNDLAGNQAEAAVLPFEGVMGNSGEQLEVQVGGKAAKQGVLLLLSLGEYDIMALFCLCQQLRDDLRRVL